MIAPHDFQPSLKSKGFSAQKWGQGSLTPKPPRSEQTVTGHAVQAHEAIRHDNDDADILLYSVKENPLAPTSAPPRTVADDGLHEGEIKRLIFAVDRWLRDGATVIFVTLGDRLLDLPGAKMRAEASEFRKAVSKAQKRAGFPAEWIAVFEMGKQERIGVHMHMLLIGSKEIIRQIRGWARFSPYMRKPSKAVQLAHDLGGFVDASGYLIEEAGNPRFAWPEGSGGGDRVIVSTTLRNAMLNEGFPAWQRTTSRDLNRKPPRARVRVKAKPVIEVVAEAAAVPQRKPILSIVPPAPTKAIQLALFDDLPEQRDGADIPDVIRAIRLQAGITQTDLAQRMGIRQPHLANVERRHDRLSRATRRAARYHLERLAA